MTTSQAPPPNTPRVIKTDKPTARASQPSTQYPWQQPGFTPRAQQVPNYERLTATERWVMDRLPGIAESGVGRALEWFNNTWAGRALQYLDIGAEGVERGIGFVAQALDANAHGQEAWDDFQANAREAWYAGSLAADFVGSPTGDMVPYTVAGGGVGAVGGAVLGSLGGPIGTFAGGLLGAGVGTGIGLAFQMGENGHESVASLVESRRQIADLVRQGMDPGDALVQVRDQMYESQGALALRSQMNDLWVHLFADPINIVAEFIKPIEALAVRRILSVERALPDEVAGVVADTQRSIDAAREIMRTAETAQNAEEISKQAGVISDLTRTLELIQQGPQMSPWQQTLLRIAGNMDWPTDSVAGRFLNSRAGRLITGPFRLTRESRAYAFVDTIETNLRAYLPQDFQEAMRTVLRARDGVYSPQIAHMVVTAEGRYVRGMMSGLGGIAQDLLHARTAAMPDRRLLELMSTVLGEDVYRVLGQMENEAPALFRRFNEALAQVPDGQRILEQTLRIGNRQLGDFTADLLKGMHGSLSGTNTVTDDLLRLEFLNRAADIAAQAGIAKFGVRARGTLLAAADAIKAAESLALLRAGNVVYPLRNWVNNVVTMIARGTYAGGGREAIADVERILGGMPTRMRSGMGMAGLAGNEGLSAAESIIARASRGERGFWNQARDWISGIHFPGDTGAWARRIEVGASQRGYASGFHRFFRQGRRALLQNLEDFAPDVANSIRARYGDDALRAANNAIRGAGTDDDILRALASTDNMHLNLENILDSASQRFGAQIDNILDDSFTARWGPEIERAARAGPAEIDNIVDRMWGEVQDELDNRLDDSLRTLTEEATERIAAEGPGSFPGVFGDAVDEFYGSYVQGHAMTMARVGDLTDLRPEVANRMMGVLLDREQRFMARGWGRLEARFQGIANGVRRMNVPGGDEVMTSFRQWRDGWGQFFEWRNTTWREFFDARVAGRAPALSFDEIRSAVNRRYDDVVAMEAERLQNIDRLVGGMLPENMRPTFAVYRDRVAALRAERATMIREWFAQVDSIPYDQRQAAYAGFWRRMMDNTSAISVEEKIGSRAVAGNAEAAATYQDDLIAASVRSEEAVRGAPLSTAEQRQIVLDRLAQYGRPQEEADLVMGRLRQVARPPEPTAGLGVPMDAEQIAAQAGVMTDAQRSAIAAQDLTTIEQIRPILAAMPPAQRQAWLVRESESSLAIGLQEGWITADELGITQESHALNNVFVTRGGWIRWGFEELNGEQVPVLTFIRGRRPGGSDVLRSWMRHNDVAGHRMFLTNELLADTVNEAGETVTRGDTFFRRMVREGAVTRLRDLPLVSGEQRILFRMGGEAQEAAHLPDFHAFVPRQLYMDTGIDQMWYLRGQHAVESIRDAALDLRGRPPLRFADLGEAEQQALRRWMSQSQVQLAQARYMGMRGAEFTRDSALLNYNRRHNYNTFLGAIMPYEFWFTESALKWALHSIDRPEMLMIYLRMQRFLNTAYRPEQNLPARLRGQIRIPMPFLPNWMGDSIFVDPMRFALPLDQFTYPFEQYQQQQQRDDGATTRVLEQLLNDGQIDQAEYQEALQTRQGTTWDRAQALARQDDDEERLSAFDFMSLFSSPHVPLQWAYNAARGTPERIGTLLPLTRSIRGVTSALGIGPAGGVNIEGNIRRELGLPEFDRWDDYRIDRMLSNMVATGEITLQQEREAMISREGEVFDLAEHRAVQEISGGPGLLGIARSVFGIPIRAYPPGEEHLRELRDEYAQAWQEYDGGDMQAVNRFFESHPEYEARVDLGYWNKPEERIRRFAVDEIWDTWNSLPQLHQNEVSEQLGPLFQNAFLDRNTRSYESIPNEMLVAWTRVMRGDPPGTLSTGPGWQIPPLDLAPRDVAYRANAFYQSRDAYFPQWRDLQSDYYLLDEGSARREYLRAHPPYAQYRAWRTDWFMRNPDVVPYLTDRPEDYTYPSEQALREAQAGQPSLQPAEWYQVLGPNIWSLLDDNQNGEALPEVARRRLQEIADQYGTTVDHILSDIAQGLAQTQ